MASIQEESIHSIRSAVHSLCVKNVKEGDIDAKYESGVLMVSIPKTKETSVKPAHKVAVS